METTMFGMFKDMKIGAEAFTDGRWCIMQAVGFDLDKIMGATEKSDLMEMTVQKLKSLPDRKYSTTQMVVALWETAIYISKRESGNPNHSLSGKHELLEKGLAIFLEQS
jgi:hypothetical protein